MPDFIIEFARFWSDCIFKGATWGGGSFAIAEILCAMTWFLNRKRSEQAQAKEDRIAKVQLPLLFTTWLATGILYAGVFILLADPKTKPAKALRNN